MKFPGSIFLLLARLSPRTVLLICLALAGLVTYLYSAEIQRREEASALTISKLKKDNSRTAEVLVANRFIKEGTILGTSDVHLESVPFDRVPRGAVQDMNSVLGSRVKYDINSGDTILGSSTGLVAEQPTGFVAKIPAGQRAITFAVDNNSSVAGFVGPDSHVDIIAQVGAGAEVKSCPILADVRVIAAGTSYKRVPGQEEAQPVSSVTVAVNPGDAGKLINAISAGRLYLTLRNDGDRTPLAVRDVGSLFNKPLPPPNFDAPPGITVLPPLPSKVERLEEAPVQAKLPPAPAPHTVELWAGSKKDEFAVSAQ